MAAHNGAWSLHWQAHLGLTGWLQAAASATQPAALATEAATSALPPMEPAGHDALDRIEKPVDKRNGLHDTSLMLQREFQR